MNRVEAELILRDASGGDSPGVGASIVRGVEGWMFTNSGFLGVIAEDPENSEGFMWYNSTDNVLRINIDGIIMESSAWTPL